MPAANATSPDPSRSDPDALLAAARRAEAAAARGRLTLFFGMAPGVGKTYAMLVAARRELAVGTDVLVGLVETHGRAETAALLDGPPPLPSLPRRAFAHRDTTLLEFDLEAALARRPALLLVDELAHTNAPGSRHAKRYQDVEELLSAGINVYTTLNVQHLASRADTVRQITGAPVHETVPDSVIEAAADIRLIDLTPAELRARLASGKVYLGERAALAAENFFQETHLTALRELALRLTAERVDKQLRDIREDTGARRVMRGGERLLVAVGPSPFSTRLVRWTRRMAYALDATWVAVSVETGEVLPADEQRRLDENLALARELGAEVVVVSDRDIAAALLRAALRHNVSQIVIGKPRSHPLLDLARGGSLVDRLVRGSGQTDVYVVPAEARTGRDRWRAWRVPVLSRPREYGVAAATLAVVTLVALVLAPYAGHSAVAFLYLATVVSLGRFIGQGPIFAAAALGALTWNFLFIPPLYTFRITKFEDGLAFALFFVVALVTGRLTTRIRAQVQAQDAGERRATALYQLTRDLAAARSADEVIRAATTRLTDVFGARPAIFTTAQIPSSYLKLNLPPSSAETGASARLLLHPSAAFVITPKEEAVALWSLRHRRPAGRFTDTLPAAEAYHVPLVVGDRALGVLALRPPDGVTLTHAQRDLIETFAAQLALALESEQLRAAQETSRLTTESEKLHRALLDGVSHELKTPLAVIAGSADALATAPAAHDALEGHPLEVSLPEEMPPLRTDFALTEQALVNLLVNASHHTPPGTPVFVSAGLDRGGTRAFFTIADRGPGLPPSMNDRLFKKFERGDAARAGGLGLGLSIVRGFITAQGGEVVVGENPGGGAVFTLYLPHATPKPETAS